jgi:uncharacterized alkaline shock family protein YloU
MTQATRPPGKTTIAPDVLVSIARLTALGIPGVRRLSLAPNDINKIFHRGANEGVEIRVENDIVNAEIHVVLNRDVNVREVSRSIQTQVARAFSEMVGMEVGKVNIHIEDIDFSPVSES